MYKYKMYPVSNMEDTEQTSSCLKMDEEKRWNQYTRLSTLLKSGVSLNQMLNSVLFCIKWIKLILCQSGTPWDNEEIVKYAPNVNLFLCGNCIFVKTIMKYPLKQQ